MSELLLLPEMLEAGVEALTESRERGLDDSNLCVAVFLAMRAIEGGPLTVMREITCATTQNNFPRATQTMKTIQAMTIMSRIRIGRS